eukprot:7391825-Prymnesium_polylepis.3
MAASNFDQSAMRLNSIHVSLLPMPKRIDPFRTLGAWRESCSEVDDGRASSSRAGCAVLTSSCSVAVPSSGGP